MFVKSSSPFKLCHYKKNVIGHSNRSNLMMSFTCVHYPHVQMVGSIFGEELLLSKKDSEGYFHIEDRIFPSKNKDMSLHNFVENFKGSDGIDFIVIKNPLYFLLTRQQDRTVHVFMTNSNDYVNMFADPEAFFGNCESKTRSYTKGFNLDFMREYKAKEDEAPGEHEATNEDKDDETRGNARGQAFVVDVNESVAEQDFEEFLKESEVTSVIRIGKRKDGIVEFRRYPLLSNTNDTLLRIVREFSACGFDFIEILGKTKIAGAFSDDGDVIWYAEAPHDNENESSYIEVLNEIFGEFAPEDPEVEE